ncbi:16S rRNA (cytosine(1402)-N(4))-methyltransferase RsmH [Segnochrobactrum spirostomi]|uniref:Ribosomal RNA small subunit methyltransferase H n=1 Tax=Segnochrobactrum spirostomi TaxID=2608987 RepID=A0A6A7Y3U1_9HYPH|nr:16S rRNA (cytosine(1402)-N(4))-methyltransferase RsmH [Segnochrobactrum spirostomi]MQT13783.1 16S rRNA (cytosine(1402)-N(4))-methyltransferase RsmH [Segnochrobactrum spirostomi]
MAASDALASPHKPVMLAEVLAALAAGPGKTVVDGTFGAGGYTRALLAEGADVIAIDRDPTAIAAGRALEAESAGRLRLVHGRFSELDRHAEALGVAAVDGVVLDVGVSSMQLDRAERGFSFRLDGPLDMRMATDGPSAADLVNNVDERDLAYLISTLGEDRKARFIARAIAERRAERPFERTLDLANVIEKAVFKAGDAIHPATRTFQALRIAVNHELDELGEALAAAERLLKAGGRLVVVAFHSLEDRIVKRFLADRTRDRPGGSRHMPETTVPEPTFRLVDRGAVAPSEAEIAENPRARSAKLRAAERTDAPARPLDLAAIGVPHVRLKGWS